MTTAARFVTYLLLVVGFAWIARRLFGANRVSWPRALGAGLVGGVTGAAVAGGPCALRHDVTPLDADVMEAELRRSVPRSDELFESVDRTPLGSASIAQVYTARLHEGGGVVVKIRRPDVDAEVRRYGRVIVDLAHRVERYSAWARTIGVADLAVAFMRDLERELDYGAEVRAAPELATSFADSGVGVPAVGADLSAGNELVMERCEGRPLSETDLGEWLPDARREAATALIAANVTAMLEGDRFQADPRPGNVMVGSDRRLWLIDFGATGVLATIGLLSGAVLVMRAVFEALENDPVARR